MAAQHRRRNCIAFLAVLAMVAAAFQPALARRSLIPQKPSIEVNLEVLNDLKSSTMASPFGVGPSPTAVSPQVMGAPVAMPSNGRKVPVQNQAYVGHAMMGSAPASPMRLPPPPMPNGGYAMYQPGGAVQPMANAVAPSRPASSYKPVKTEPKKEEVKTEKAPSDNLPSIEKLNDALPEPDLTNMDFDDFPALQPLPPTQGSNNFDDIPLPEVPQVGNAPSEPQMPQMPDFTNMDPSSGPEPMMPSLDQGFNDFITSDNSTPMLPSPNDVMPPGPSAMPEMPGLPTMPGEQQVASIEPEFPTIEAPTMETPSAIESSGKVLLSIPYATTEDEVPVSSQKKLTSLAQQLISSGQPVEIRAYMKADSDSTVASSIGLRRSFAVRSYLIDSGVNENNVASVGNPTVSGDTAKERVEIVAR